MRLWRALVGVGSVIAYGCGQSGPTGQPGTPGGPTGQPGTPGVGASEPPFPHRAVATDCSRERAVGLPGPATSPDAGPLGGGCNTDADCTQFTDANGRCVPPGAPNLRGVCSYETCFSDADCHTSSSLRTGVCLCGGPIVGQSTRSANACFPGECRVDADCTGDAGSFCSQAMVYQTCFGGRQFAAFFCRSLREECTTDADCAEAGPNTYCSFVGNGKRWACLPPVRCAG